MTSEWAVVVPWANPVQLDAFLQAWHVPRPIPEWLVLQRDEHREGCGATKNKGVVKAVEMGASVVVVLDDDCFPDEVDSLVDHAERHARCLDGLHEVELFEVVTDPPSRGTPYGCRTALMPPAASMGFWTEIGDHCAVRQLATNGAAMSFCEKTVYQRWFPLCGMNLAFRPGQWDPWCRFIEVPRFDDIWMGWLWQREAYRRGHCFNLRGPMVRHSRQSNVWRNLQEEAVYLEANEVLWRTIATSPRSSYWDLRRLLPT